MQLKLKSPLAVKFGRFRSSLLIGFIALSAAVAGGCGGSNRFNTGYGNVFVTYTGVGGDFASYTMVVSSVTFKRSDGTVASGVSAAETVDFAKLSDVTEMVSNTAIPIGTYTSATVNLDYTSAKVLVKDGSVPASAKVVDGTGAAPGAVTVVVTFDPANPLVIPQSGAQRLNLEFNLAASNRIDYSTSPPTVTIAPFMTANNNPNTAKPIRVRGPMVSYNSQQGSYTVYVRPFLDEGSSLGSLTLFGTPTTAYLIDNQGFVGQNGITAITNLGTGRISSALTTYAPDSSAGSFTLTQSYIATATESGVADRIEGTVIGRSGNTLTLRGSTLSLRTGGFTYYPTDATVTVADATGVSIDGQPTATGVNQHAVSVGQNIIAFGQSTVTSGVVTLDATAGQVRLAPTRLWGSVTAGGAGAGTLDLRGIGDWPINSFSFVGTGTSAAKDANPASYSVSAGSADLSALLGEPAAADGIVAAFGAAPPDFLATSVAAVKTVDSRLSADWGAGGTVTPFTVVSSTSLQVNLSDPNLGTVHSLVAGSFTTDLTTLAASPAIVPATTGRPSFAIGSAAAGISVFSHFSDFVAQLNTASTAGKAVLRVVATGPYDAASNTLTASSISVVLK
jgi:hypothetical protein